MLALGIGANVATFSVMDAILLRMLPVKEPGALFRTVRANGNAYDSGYGVSYKVMQQMQERTASLADLMAYGDANEQAVSINQSGINQSGINQSDMNQSDSERLTQQTVSGNSFQMLGVEPAFGTMISPADDHEPGQHAVAVISYRLWKQKFDKRADALGSKLQFGDQVFNIIGVAPRKFFGIEVGKVVDVWTPIAMAPLEMLRNEHLFWLRTMGRLHPGVTIAQAAAIQDS